MNWITDFVRPKVKKVTIKDEDIADNLWIKCPVCGKMLFSKELKKRESLKINPQGFIFSSSFVLMAQNSV